MTGFIRIPCAALLLATACGLFAATLAAPLLAQATEGSALPEDDHSTIFDHRQSIAGVPNPTASGFGAAVSRAARESFIVRRSRSGHGPNIIRTAATRLPRTGGQPSGNRLAAGKARVQGRRRYHPRSNGTRAERLSHDCAGSKAISCSPSRILTVPTSNTAVPLCISVRASPMSRRRHTNNRREFRPSRRSRLSNHVDPGVRAGDVVEWSVEGIAHLSRRVATDHLQTPRPTIAIDSVSAPL